MNLADGRLKLALSTLLPRELKAAARGGRHNRADVGETGGLREKVERNAGECGRGHTTATTDA